MDLFFSKPMDCWLEQFSPRPITWIGAGAANGAEMLASADQAWNSVASLSKAIFLSIAILLLAFYWTLEGPRTIQALLPLIPRDQRQGTYELISAMESKVGYFIAGQGILCLIVGIMALAAYLLIGLPNALVLALIAGIV